MIKKNLTLYEKFYDKRGFMSPLVEKKIISDENLCIKYSKSNFGVVRGFHWQRPPYLQEKQVFVLSGEIMDLICPVVNNQLQIEKIIRNKVNADDNSSIFIPSNYAHAYKAISEDTIILYVCNGQYNKEYELTIKADEYF